MTPDPRRVAVLGGHVRPGAPRPPRRWPPARATPSARARRGWCPARTPALRDGAGRSAAPAPGHARGGSARHARRCASSTSSCAGPACRTPSTRSRRCAPRHPGDEPWWIVGRRRGAPHPGMASQRRAARDGPPGGRAARRVAGASTTRRRARWGSTRSVPSSSTSPLRTSARPRCAAASRAASRSPGWCRAPVADIISASGLYRSAPVR